MSFKILDVSKYQPVINYAKVATQIDGVIIRCGITYWGKQDMGVDTYFEKHYNGFKAAGVPVGVYYYSAADSEAVAKKEAEFCLSILKDNQFELPIYYDVENNERQGKLTKEQLTAITDTFCSIIQAQGYFVGYYSYTAWLQSKFDYMALSKKYSLWKADYRTFYDNKIACDMHQYTSSGELVGISGRVDMNNCFVDFTKIIKEKGLNGFDKAVTTQPISTEPISLKIGFTSSGDIKTISKLLNNLRVSHGEQDGYITTVSVSAGDQVKIIELCNSLTVNIKANLPTAGNDCECSALKATNEQLTAEILKLTKVYNDTQKQLEKVLADRDRLLAENIVQKEKVNSFKTGLNELLNKI